MDEDDRHHCLALIYHVLGRQPEAESELSKFQSLDGERAAGSPASGIDDVRVILRSFLEFAPDEGRWSKISHVKVSD